MNIYNKLKIVWGKEFTICYIILEKCFSNLSYQKVVRIYFRFEIIFQFNKRKLSVTKIIPPTVLFLKDAQWKRIVPRSLDLNVMYSIGFVCSRPFEWYKTYQNRTSETYLKLIRICLIALMKMKCQGHFCYILCLISSLSNIPVKSSVSCGDLD